MSMGITDPLELLQQENEQLKLENERLNDSMKDRDKEIERLTKIMDKAIAILSD